MNTIPTHLELPPSIEEGLLNGTLRRIGGVVRRTPGQPGAGQIVTHLREVQPADMMRFSRHQIGGPPVLPPLAAQALQLTQVAAAASVLNLGVSVVGFTVMNHKLNRLQSNVERIAQDLSEFRADVFRQLSQIHQQLVELKYLQVQALDALTDMHELASAIRKDLLTEKVARLSAWMRDFTRGQDTSTLRNALLEIDATRIWLEHTIAVPGPTSAMWADTAYRYRIWCMAVVMQVGVTRKLRRDEEAAVLAFEAAQQSRHWIRQWAAVLLPENDFEGIFRLGASPFRKLVHRETIERLARLQLDQELESLALDRKLDELALRIIGQRKHLDPLWVEVSTSAAHLLDLGAETHERLSSLADEMKACWEHRLGFDEWEALPIRVNRPTLLAMEMPA